MYLLHFSSTPVLELAKKKEIRPLSTETAGFLRGGGRGGAQGRRRWGGVAVAPLQIEGLIARQGGAARGGGGYPGPHLVWDFHRNCYVDRNWGNNRGQRQYRGRWKVSQIQISIKLKFLGFFFSFLQFFLFCSLFN